MLEAFAYGFVTTLSNRTSTEDDTSDDKSEVVLKVIVEAEMEIRGWEGKGGNWCEFIL